SADLMTERQQSLAQSLGFGRDWNRDAILGLFPELEPSQVPKGRRIVVVAIERQKLDRENSLIALPRLLERLQFYKPPGLRMDISWRSDCQERRGVTGATNELAREGLSIFDAAVPVETDCKVFPATELHSDAGVEIAYQRRDPRRPWTEALVIEKRKTHPHIVSESRNVGHIRSPSPKLGGSQPMMAAVQNFRRSELGGGWTLNA